MPARLCSEKGKGTGRIGLAEILELESQTRITCISTLDNEGGY